MKTAQRLGPVLEKLTKISPGSNIELYYVYLYQLKK